jgi:hypothetical protein
MPGPIFYVESSLVVVNCKNVSDSSRACGASMSIQVKKLHPAIKHGAYSATALLPGEDSAAFTELHQKIIAELAPSERSKTISLGR